MIELKGSIGKYRILKKIGSGGFGTVYLAEDTFLKSLRALKIPHRIGIQTEKLLQESALQSKLLQHPNIVKLLTVDVIDNVYIMVMEYIDGTDLESLIDSRNNLELPTALRYLRQILSAVGFAHEYRVIHRDIRPSNVLIDKGDNVKVTDFGTSTLLEGKPFATTRIGSPPYMAPEQFEGRAVLASDIYSIGCLFYEMVTGFPPIVLANPMEIYKKAKAGEIQPLRRKAATVSDELDHIVMTMLQPDPARRYKKVDVILQELDQAFERPRDHGNEIRDIQSRITAREQRTDYICWNCKKVMPRPMRRCIYCGAEQYPVRQKP
ncbi:MAG: serine/threonine-protein kinase [Acidobacteriota bacterium]|jgi:serine/threonine-protein kinase|nr:serine/threonine-protein kinase [Acidobacteriota bacterium]